MIISAAIIKGGTGKSTTAAALAQAAEQDGRRVLCIDLDAQANLTYFLGAQADKQGAFSLISEGRGRAQTTEQNIDIYAASAELSLLTTGHGSARRLRAALEPIRGGYDLIIIDTPPAIGDLTYNALFASERLRVPLEPDANGLQGLRQIIGIAEQIRETNKELSLLGAFITRYTAQSKINRYLRDTIAAQVCGAGLPYLGEIRQAVAIKEAQTLQKNLFEYAPRSNAAKDYLRLYRAIMEGSLQAKENK